MKAEAVPVGEKLIAQEAELYSHVRDTNNYFRISLRRLKLSGRPRLLCERYTLNTTLP